MSCEHVAGNRRYELRQLERERDLYDLDIDCSYDWGDYGNARRSEEKLKEVEKRIAELEGAEAA